VSAPTATDNCVGSITGTTGDPLVYTVQGTYTITWSYDDGNGNTSTQNQTVIVDDLTAPVWTLCPSNISVVNDLGDCTGGTIFWTAPTVSDNCDASPNVTLPTWSSGDFFPLGITTVSYSVVDVSGNTGTCSFTVEVTILDADNDGTCDELDCNDSDPNLTVPGASCDDGNAATLNDVVTPSCTCEGTPFLDLSVIALLDGPYNEASDLMTDVLRSSNLLPSAQPYNSAPFGYAGTETVAPAVLAVTGNQAIVDWVLIELRDKVNPSVIVARRAALVQRDGDIVDVNGVTPVRFLNLLTNDYHVAVRHRNHLATMTSNPVTLSALPVTVDFTNTGFANYGTTPANALTAQRTRDGKRLLWSGNLRHDNVVKYAGSGNDRDPILLAIGGLVPTNVVSNVYDRLDLNLDGQISYAGAGNDRDPILVNLNSNVLGQRFQQLP
jgi:hypothetical protein